MDTLFYSVRSPVHSLKVYDTGFASLMDDTGRILYHPRLKPGTRVEEVSPNLNPELFRRESNGSELIRYNAEGQRRQVSFTTLANGLKLVVAAPVTEIFSSWQKMTQSILVSALAILAIFALVTLFVVGAVTKPLLRLTSASQKLAAGDYNAELDYEGDDEVGILTQSFRQMRDHLKLYISDLNSRAFSDALTGIKNKGAFDTVKGRLNDMIRHGGLKSGQEFAVVMFDCNNLKHINDDFGHEQGDFYLRTAARVICQTFAHSPVFRLGGDEFAAVLQREDYRDRDELLRVFDKNAEAVNANAKNPWEKVDIAKGMAEFRPGMDTDIDQVMRRADEQMYENKRQGKLTAAVSIPNFDAIES
jgi:diguanylate cyclase (GGDEF)-like protein